MKSLMHREWNLHLSRVVIDDGEQPECHVGDVLDWFAISFRSNTALTRTAERAKAAVPIPGNSYRVNAEIIYVPHDPKQAACILDFGIKAISVVGALNILPAEYQGEYVTGEVRLELPLCTTLHPQNLAHRWRVNRISANLTSHVPHHPVLFWRRKAPSTTAVRYQDVVGTDSVHAESQVLHCSELDP